jgi:UDPglucose 6-dehydrogenase
MNIAVVGMGVVGGTLARILQEEGHEVGAYDPHKGHDDLTKIRKVDLAFVCVWTPQVGAQLDQSAVFDAVQTLWGQHVENVAIRSTIKPGTITRLQGLFPSMNFAFVPEFLVESDPYGSSRHADRIVIGSESSKMIGILDGLMRSVSPGAPVVVTDSEEAVMIKLASNVMLAAKVSVANELKEICDQYGLEWDNIRGVVGMDRRIGPEHLRVTEERGYGGSCFPKDMRGMITAAHDVEVTPTILEEIERTNAERRLELNVEAVR